MQPTHGADIPHVFPNNQNKNDNYGTNHTNLPPVNAPLSQHPLNVGQRQGVLEPQSQGHPNPQYQYGPSQQQTPSAVASGNKSIQNINLGYIDPRQNITPTMNLTNSHISPHASSMTAGSSFIPEKQFSQYKSATFETHKLNAQQSQNVHPQLMATIHQTGLPSAGSPTNAANLPTQYTAQRPVSMTSNSQNNHIQLNQRTKEASQYTGSVLNSTQHVPTTNLQTISQNTQPPISRNNSVNSNNSLSTSNVYSGPIPSAKNDYKNSHISAAPNSFPPHQYVTGNFPQNTSSNPNPYLYQSTSSTLPNSENSNLTTPPHLPHSSQSIPLAQSSQMGPNFPSNYTPNSNHSSVINPSLPSKLSVDVNLSRNTHPTAIQSVELLGEPRTNYPSDQHTSHPANTIPAVASGSIRPQGFIQGISKSKHPNDKIDVLSENMQHLKMDTQLPVPILGTPQPLDDLDRAPLANMQTVPSLDPSFVRTSFTSFPRSSTCLNKTKIPFGITFTPYPSFSTSPEGKPTTQVEIPVVVGPIVRCRRCRTYLNPYVEVSEQGTRWRCNLCVLLNDFPSNYDYNVGESRYIDRGEHPELRCPVYEYYAPAEYTVRPPQPPVYVFLLDASNSSINAGILQATAISISTTILANLPNCSGRTKVALMTYDLNSVHYYLFSREESENSRLPRMLVVTEFDDTQAAPSPEDLIVDLEKSSESFKLALDSLPSIHAANKALPIGSCLGSAVSLAMRLAAPYGGKIVAVHASPVVKGDGSTVASSNSNRPVSTDSVTRMLGTPKESSLLQPASSYYKSLAADCSKTQVSIDIFAFAPDINPPQISHGSIKITNNYNPTYLHLDLATLSTMTKHTGGRLFYYTVPAAGINSDESLSQKYTGDLNSHLCDKNLGLEAVLRIRASQGLSISGYHGSFFLRSTDLLSLPNVNPAHSYTAQVTIEETLQGNRVAFQAAVLHTNTRGERRIRVINASLPLTDDPRELISSADAPMIGSLLARMAIDKTVGSEGVGGIFSGAAGGRLEDARDAILNKTIDILSASRTINATTQHAPIPLLHPTLRILPLLLLACAKSLYLRPGPSSYPDARIHVMCLTKTMCVRDLIRSLHPYLIAIHTLSIDKNAQPNLPKPLPLSSEVLERHGLFLMHDASDFYFWIGSECHSQLLTLLFGNPNVQPGSIILPTLENEWNLFVHNIMNKLVCQSSSSKPRIFVIRDDSPPAVKAPFLSRLIEDRLIIDSTSNTSQPSYASWVSLLREKLSSSK